MSSPARIVVLYTLFAAIATAANIGCQVTVIWLYSGQFTKAGVGLVAQNFIYRQHGCVDGQESY